jgi:phage host-nuclease inhibitor protein Gam
MAKKPRIVVPVPKDRLEAEALAQALGERQRRIERAKLDAADQIARIKEGVARQVADDQAAGKAELAVLAGWCFANRDELLPKGRKSVAISAGMVGWRTSPPKVVMEDEEALIAQLRAMGRDHLVVETETVSKEGLLQERAELKGLPGLTFSQDEVFFFQALDVEAEITTKVASAREAA